MKSEAYASKVTASACIIAMTVIVASSTASAQTSGGVKGGLSLASFSGSTIEQTTWKGGYAAGVFVTVGMVDELSFQSEAMFQQKGANIGFTERGNRTSAAVHLDYIDVNVLLRLDVPLPESAISVYLMGGPSGSVNVGCTVTTTEDGTSADRGCTTSGADMAVRALDFSMIGGGGLRVLLSRAAVFIEGRYAVGLGPIDSGAASWNRTNQAFAILGGISVPLHNHATLAARH
jgi:hypothetical protein